MRTGFTRYSLYATLACVGLSAWTPLAVAQKRPSTVARKTPLAAPQMTMSAGDVSGRAGQTVAVPITINLGAANVAFFGATLSVVPQGKAPAVAEKLTYRSATGVPAPDLHTAVQAKAKLAIGYAGVTIKPPLKGKMRIGTLMVPIPARAGGQYQVQVSNISAGDSSGSRVAITGQPGTIRVAVRRKPH
jgi:hypothetical protein